jgi:hypothetical protein
MRKKRVFTQQELDALGARTLDLLLEAIESGDRQASSTLAKRMYAEFLGMHDFYRDWLTDLFSHVGKRYGDEGLSQAMEETVNRFSRRLSERYKGKPPRRRMEVLMAGLRGHLHPIRVVEDDEKFTLMCDVCGSGGRQIRDGLYDTPEGLLRVKEPQAMTFNRPDFPVYCVHCYFANDAPLHEDGSPMFVCEPSTNPGYEPCRITIEKKGVWIEEG